MMEIVIKLKMKQFPGKIKFKNKKIRKMKRTVILMKLRLLKKKILQM